jgi:hypothetical protein
MKLDYTNENIKGHFDVFSSLSSKLKARINDENGLFSGAKSSLFIGATTTCFATSRSVISSINIIAAGFYSFHCYRPSFSKICPPKVWSEIPN